MRNKIVAVIILLLSGSFSSTVIQSYVILFELLLFIYILTNLLLTLGSKMQRIKYDDIIRPLITFSTVIGISMINSIFVLKQSLFTMLNNHFDSILGLLFLVIMTYNKKKFSYSSILRHLEVMTLILVMVFILIQTTSQNEIVMVKGALSGIEHTYNIQNIGSILFVFFGIRRFLYFVKCFELKSLFLAFLYLGYPIVFQNSRILIISLALVAFFSLFRAPKRVQQKGILLCTSVVVLLFSLYYFGGPKGFVQTKYSSLKSAITLVFTGEELGAEVGTSIRILEMKQALTSLKNRYLLGTGSIGNSWGTSGENYFYSSDIGILGIVLEVGLIGLLLLVTAFLGVYRVFKVSSTELKYFFHLLLLINLTTGYLYFELLPTLTFLSLAIIKTSQDDSMDNSILL